jgi:hypothetical protein
MKTSFDKLMIQAAWVYVILPFLLFCIGWLRMPWSIIMVAILVLSYILTIKATKNYYEINLKQHSRKIILALSTIIVLVIFSGIGEYSYQVEDHQFRNGVFHDLVTHHWPLKLNERGNLPTLHQPVLYIYYIEYWLPAALIGKLFGWAIANFFLWLWTVAGSVLTFYFLCRYFKRFSLKILLMFFFFNTVYILVSFLKYPVGSVISSDYKIWSGQMVLAGSNIDSLYWIYNQTVTPLLIIAMLLNKLSRQSIGFLFALCYLHGPFTFIGFFPFLCILLVKDIFISKEGTFMSRIQPYLTFQNLIGSVAVMFIGYFYLSGSPAVQSLYIGKISPLKYLVFIMVEFGIISLLIFSKYKKDPYYYMTLAMLLILPVIGMGTIQPFTFCARVSIAPMFVLMVLVTKYILEERSSTTNKLVVAYVVLSAIDPLLQVGRSVVFTIGHYIDPVATNTCLYNRAGEWSNWKNLVPDRSKWKEANFNILNVPETSDTTINPFLSVLEKQNDTPFFNKYLLKKIK